MLKEIKQNAFLGTKIVFMETIELWNIIKKGRKASTYRVHDIINVC